MKKPESNQFILYQKIFSLILFYSVRACYVSRLSQWSMAVMRVVVRLESEASLWEGRFAPLGEAALETFMV